MAQSMIPLLLLCMAFLQSTVALHLCVDWLFNNTQGRHEDGLPHLNPTEEATWMALLPRKLGAKAEFDWLALYRSLTRGGNDHAPKEFLSQASLHDVRLDPGSMYWQGQQTNLEYLLYLDADRLTWSFRQQAGLPTIGEHYGGWEAPDGQLRGHFVGHYLSASAHMWASTHNDTLREKMTWVVDILDHCQRKMNTGYLSAYPETMFDMYEDLSEAWSPYYTIHKIMQGLLDQYTLAGNPKGLEMVVWMTDYFSERVKNYIMKYSIQRHWEAMNEETGGLNDVMYQLYTITKKQKHLTMAHLFDKPCFLGPLSLHDDDIAGLHVNTHVPVLIGAQKRYEVVGDTLYKDIATFFFDVVNSSHTFATGGTSTMEHWHDPKRLVDEIKISSNEETCATYNLLKVSRNLFRWTKEVKYADHYERLLINGIMGNQRGTEPAVMIYFLPMGPGRSKSISGVPPSGLPPKMPGGWGGPNDTFWCCYGTGNPLSFISAIEPLNGGNYGSWREKVEIALALSDIDLALTTECPTAPEEPVRGATESNEDFTARERDHATVRMKYDIDRAKWDQSNRKCLMVIKSSIVEAIRGVIPECTTATEYLKKVGSQFTGSSKAYASSLIKKLVTEKYHGGGVREHILRMSNMASKLKPMDMELKDEFVVHLIFASLSKEFEAFEINYNAQADKWGIEKLIAMCVQEEERLKGSQGDSINYVKQNKKKNYNNSKPQGKPQWDKSSSSKAHGKAPQNDHYQKSNNEGMVDKDTCKWCKNKGHYQKDCADFLKHLIKKGIPYEENPAKRRKNN